MSCSLFIYWRIAQENVFLQLKVHDILIYFIHRQWYVTCGDCMEIYHTISTMKINFGVPTYIYIYHKHYILLTLGSYIFSYVYWYHGGSDSNEGTISYRQYRIATTKIWVKIDTIPRVVIPTIYYPSSASTRRFLLKWWKWGYSGQRLWKIKTIRKAVNNYEH